MIGYKWLYWVIKNMTPTIVDDALDALEKLEQKARRTNNVWDDLIFDILKLIIDRKDT